MDSSAAVAVQCSHLCAMCRTHGHSGRASAVVTVPNSSQHILRAGIQQADGEMEQRLHPFLVPLDCSDGDGAPHVHSISIDFSVSESAAERRWLLMLPVTLSVKVSLSPPSVKGFQFSSSFWPLVGPCLCPPRPTVTLVLRSKPSCWALPKMSLRVSTIRLCMLHLPALGLNPSTKRQGECVC
jgi:hypothetical protein